MSPRKHSAPAQSYELLVTLSDTQPLVWRRLRVSADLRLDRFHRVLQSSMGWKDSHLHKYRIGGFTIRPLDPEEPLGINDIDERTIGLDIVLKRENDAFVYEYDFGDGWRHEIVLETIAQADPSGLPVCLGGERACPPEDCGGPGGYENLIDALRDSSHPDHAELKRWAGRKFDPEAFDLAAVNKRLAKRR